MDDFKNTHMPHRTNKQYKELVDARPDLKKDFQKLTRYMKKKYPGGIKRPRVLNQLYFESEYRYSWVWESVEKLRQLDEKYK